MTAAEIAAALGRAHRSGDWWRCRCPFHGSRGPTLALRDGDRGLIVKCFADCDPRDILAELRRRGMIEGRGEPPAEPRPSRPIDRGNDGRRNIESARRLWVAAQEARGSPVVPYLASRRITLTPPPSLRWAPALRRPDGTNSPAMIARIDNIDGELIGIARTWLARDAAGSWHRHDRAMLGRATGGAVRLAPAAETLMIGEGIETCLSAMQATEMPAWAALSTSGMVALILPASVRTVVILADNDHNGAGERAARAAARRWLAEGRRVRIAMPPEPDSDFADVLLGRNYDRIEEVRDVAA
jgi:putative DNA primase/helicase